MAEMISEKERLWAWSENWGSDRWCKWSWMMNWHL